MDKKTAEKVIIEMINGIKSVIKEEFEAVDDATKAKWQIVEAAKNVFNANYNYTNFPENSHEGVVGVYKPTLHQLDSFNHEIRNLATISMIDTEEKENEIYIAIRIKLTNGAAVV